VKTALAGLVSAGGLAAGLAGCAGGGRVITLPSVQLSSAVTGTLLPGATARVSLRVTNPSARPATVAPPVDATVVTGRPSCRPAWFRYTPAPDAAKLTVPAHGTVLVRDAGSLTFKTGAADPSACAGVSVTLQLAAR